VAFQCAAGFACGPAFGLLAGKEVAGARVDARLDDRDSVQGSVELGVAAAVEAVAVGGLAGSARDRSAPQKRA
jgi:hypothetical protein